MRKKILIVMGSLSIGGAEKALVSLLNHIDYKKLDVDLLLFSKTGKLIDKVPEDVNIITFNDVNSKAFLSMNLINGIKLLLKSGRLFLALIKLMISLKARCCKNIHPRQMGYMSFSKYIPQFNKEYDTAIAFINNNPIYYIVDKVKAKTKMGFIRSDYEAAGYNPDIDKPYFKKLDYLLTVSEKNMEKINGIFPEFAYKTCVLKNITSAQYIRTLAQEKINFDDQYTGIKIVTVARTHPMKGIDLAVEACKLLVDEGLDIRWYFIGYHYNDNIVKMTKKYNISDRFISVGELENPYPIQARADIYVQSSRSEGRCNAILEAMILGRPIIVTDFPTAKEQIAHKVNGLIVPLSSKGIAQGIKTLISDKKLREDIASRALQEEISNEEEIQKFYDIVGT